MALARAVEAPRAALARPALLRLARRARPFARVALLRSVLLRAGRLLRCATRTCRGRAGRPARRESFWIFGRRRHLVTPYWRLCRSVGAEQRRVRQRPTLTASNVGTHRCTEHWNPMSFAHLAAVALITQNAASFALSTPRSSTSRTSSVAPKVVSGPSERRESCRRRVHCMESVPSSAPARSAGPTRYQRSDAGQQRRVTTHRQSSGCRPRRSGAVPACPPRA